MKFSDELKTRRINLGLSQVALAEKVSEYMHTINEKGISQQAIAKIEKGGKSIYVAEIQRVLDALELKAHGHQVAEATVATYNIPKLDDRYAPVWLISWVTAGDLCEAEDPYPPGQGEELIPCPVPHSPSTFALRVDGLSMDDGTPDGYRDGEIIFVDPECQAQHNSDVIARTPEGKTTFKRLQETQEGQFLLALNPDWPARILKVPEGTTICGVVTGSFRQRKR